MQSASALTATLAATNLTLAANKLYQSIGAGIGALADSGGMLSAADLRPRAARPVLQSGPGPHPLYRQEPRWTAPTPCSATPWAAPPPPATMVARRWSRPGAPLSRPGLRRPVGRGQGRVDNVGVGILARYWFLGGTYAEASRSGRMRGSYRRYRWQHQLPEPFELLGRPRHAGPCGAVERARQLDAYARVQWQRLGGDAVRND